MFEIWYEKSIAFCALSTTKPPMPAVAAPMPNIAAGPVSPFLMLESFPLTLSFSERVTCHAFPVSVRRRL